MKVAIIYYSFSGNTQRMCEFLLDKLSRKEVLAEQIVLKPKKETRSFFTQGRLAFLRKEVELLNIEDNMSLAAYDFIIFASPVWAFTITPAMRSYISKAQGLQRKKCAALLTAGSIKGAGRALDEFVSLIRGIEGEVVFRKVVVGKRTKDREYLEEELRPLLKPLVKC